ncbi:MAG TPA: hypothetical protein VGD66_00675 [Allosphingosinicella sp.]|jgi:hypothetical protein
MDKVIHSLPTSDAGLDRVEMDFNGVDLLLVAVSPLGSTRMPSSYDTFIQVDLEGSVADLLSSPAGRFVIKGVRQYRLFLSNHGSLELVATGADVS